MKTDRLVNSLNKIIEEKFPIEKTQGDLQEGINIWKGKRIISIEQWLKMTAGLENNIVMFDISKGFNHFPDSTSEVIFQYNSEGPNEYLKEIPKEEFDKWFDDYLNLLTYKKNSDLGGMICKNCLLDPTKDRSGIRIGIHKMVSKTIEKELQINSGDTKNQNEKLSIYPCNVRNYFSCPYGSIGKDKKFVHEFSPDIEYLFELEKITSLVDLSLLKASSMTKSNESVYEIDIEIDTMKEIQTLYDGEQIAMILWSPIEKGVNQILDKSVIPVRNKEDVLEILKDRDKLDKILRQGLSKKDYEKWKEKILILFDQLKCNLDMNLTYKYDVYKTKEMHNCFICTNPANICLLNEKERWRCLKHWISKISK